MLTFWQRLAREIGYCAKRGKGQTLGESMKIRQEYFCKKALQFGGQTALEIVERY